MSGIDGDWTKPAAMAIPKEGYFEEERGRYGPILPTDSRLLRVLHHREGEGGPRGRGPGVRQDHRRDHRSEPGGVGAAQVALLAVESLRRRFWSALPVHGHLRHRLRQVHRGRGAAVQRDRHHDRFHPISKVPGGLEGEPGGVHQIRPRSPVPSFLEYGEYPYVTADEIKKALRLKAAFSTCSTRCSNDAGARVRRHSAHPADPHAGDHRALRVPVVRHPRRRPGVADRVARQGAVGGRCAGHGGQLGSLGHVGVHVEWPARARRARGVAGDLSRRVPRGHGGPRRHPRRHRRARTRTLGRRPGR